MRSIFLTAVAVISFLFVPAQQKRGSITGSVNPQESVLKIYLFNKVDTFETVSTNGNYSFNNIKPGTYNLLIQAKAPYIDVGKKGIKVQSGRKTKIAFTQLKM